jgi:hypothetical protein
VAGGQWRAFDESMPGPCSSASGATYTYALNPAVYYTSLRRDCPRWDVGLGQWNPDAMPTFAFVTPNLCHDMHNCAVSAGDQWLARMLPALLDTLAYRRGDTAIFVTWDEDDWHHANQVPLLVIAPSVAPGTVIRERLDHYSLLRTTEQMLDLPPLGAAASVASIPGL